VQNLCYLNFNFEWGAAAQQTPLWVRACPPTSTIWGSHNSAADS